MESVSELGSGSTGDTLQNGLTEGITLAILGVEEEGRMVVDSTATS